MPQLVALLRGINVGGHRVTMDRLRMLFEELDLQDVSTFIASGNMIFTSKSNDLDDLTISIESHLERALGYEVATFLRTPAQLAAIATLRPKVDEAEDTPASSHYVIFLRDRAPEPLRSAFSDLNSEMDDFRFSGQEIHWHIQGKLSESPLFGGGTDRALRGVPHTVRNMTTVRRLVAKSNALKTP